MTGKEREFLATYDPARAKALIELFAKNHTWQVPTLFWEKGEWLIEQTNTGPDPLLKYAPVAWRERTWPMFTSDITKHWSTDPLAEREKSLEGEPAGRLDLGASLGVHG